MALLLSLLVITGRSSLDDHVGAQVCGQCHQRIYNAWRKHAHGKALEPLSPTERRDVRCVGCHTLGPGAALAGVQCESCHGPGRHYAADYIMRDRPLAEALGLRSPGDAVCQRCHTPRTPSVEPFAPAAWRARLSHGQP